MDALPGRSGLLSLAIALLAAPSTAQVGTGRIVIENVPRGDGGDDDLLDLEDRCPLGKDIKRIRPNGFGGALCPAAADVDRVASVSTNDKRIG